MPVFDEELASLEGSIEEDDKLTEIIGTVVLRSVVMELFLYILVPVESYPSFFTCILIFKFPSGLPSFQIERALGTD